MEQGRGLSAEGAARTQYATAERLSTRISIHAKYSVNREGFGPWICRHYEIPEGGAVLELGCGTGSMWAGQDELIARCGRLVLTDLSPGMLEAARETLRAYPSIEYAVADIQQIPYERDSFDLVIANMMLYHVPDLDRGLAEVRRVLKPGGAFCSATYGEHGLLESLTALFRAWLPAEEETAGGFTLQSGGERLRRHFREVRRLDYPDALAVTDMNDLADYIGTLEGLSALRSLPRETVLRVLEDACTGGVLRLPKEYGLFISR